VDIGANSNLELVDKSCYLGDILSVHGDTDAAVEARIRIGWNKFRQLVPLLTNRDMFCSLAFLDPRVGHTMDVLSPFISILCHSD